MLINRKCVINCYFLIKMSELSMVETLKLWDEAVSSTERGRYEDALIKFMSLEQLTADSNQSLITSARNLFNIGQTYFSLDRIDMSIKAFQESLAKDKMLAIAHFMLGCAHLKQSLYKDALLDFENALFFLRGNRLIDYKQLGLKYKLYSCEILCNKAISYAYLGKDQQAKGDFLKAVESCVEPRHGAIQDTLICWQKGKSMEPILVPPIAVFQPSKSKLQVTKGTANYLGKSQVVASRVKEANEQKVSSDDAQKSSQVSKEDPKPNVVGFFNDRNKLMKDLRNKETRKSLKKTNIIKSNILQPLSLKIPPPRPASPHPTSPRPTSLRPTSPRPTSPRPTSPRPTSPRPTSPYPGNRRLSGPPPTKPLPPSPRSKSPVPFNFRPLPPNPGSHTIISPTPVRPPKRQGRTVTFELIVNRSVQVNEDVTTNQLSQAAAKALGVSEDTFTMCFHGDGKMMLPNSMSYQGCFDNGLTKEGKYVFSDELVYEMHKDWGYCDVNNNRMFAIELQNGLKPAGRCLLTNTVPPRVIPDGMHDSGDGFYDPEKRILYTYNMKFLRTTDDEEHGWIVGKCRKAERTKETK